MSKKLGLATYERPGSALLGSGMPLRTHDFSEATAREIDEEVRGLLDSALIEAKSIIKKNVGFIDSCVETLMNKETLDESELKELWRAHKISGEPRLAVAPG
jgi:ATP-dependent Zn protease